MLMQIGFEEMHRIKASLRTVTREPGTARRVLFAALKALDPQSQRITVTQQELAQRLDMDKGNLSRAFRALQQLGAVRMVGRDPTRHRVRIYELNPNLATMLPADQRALAAAAWRPAPRPGPACIRCQSSRRSGQQHH